MEKRSELAKVEAVGKRSVWSTALAIGMRRFARIAGGWTTVAVGALVSATVASSAGSLPLAPVSLNASGAYNGLQVKPATIVYTGDGTGFLGLFSFFGGIAMVLWSLCSTRRGVGHWRNSQ